MLKEDEVLEVAELEEQEELFLMSNLYPKRTGLPFIVWISTGSGVQHDVRVKVSRGGKVRPSEMVSVALRPAVHVTKGSLSSEELEQLTAWIELNREVLLRYWNEEMDTGDVLEQLRVVEPEKKAETPPTGLDQI